MVVVLFIFLTWTEPAFLRHLIFFRTLRLTVSPSNTTLFCLGWEEKIDWFGSFLTKILLCLQQLKISLIFLKFSGIFQLKMSWQHYSSLHLPNGSDEYPFIVPVSTLHLSGATIFLCPPSPKHFLCISIFYHAQLCATPFLLNPASL